MHLSAQTIADNQQGRQNWWETTGMVVAVLWVGRKRRGVSPRAVLTSASDHLSHSWLPWAGAQRLSEPQVLVGLSSAATLGASELWFFTLIIPLCTSPCLTGAREKSLCRGWCAFLLKQMLLYWTPDFAINFGLFFAICLSQSCFSSGCKPSRCDFVNPGLPLLSASGSLLGLQTALCSPPLAWLEQSRAYGSRQAHYRFSPQTPIRPCRTTIFILSCEIKNMLNMITPVESFSGLIWKRRNEQW